MQTGDEFNQFLRRFRNRYKQGQHTIISGITGSGKTVLARRVADVRLANKGFTVVVVSKIGPDRTLSKDYKDFKRWKRWKRVLTKNDNKILLQPDVSGLTLPQQISIQRTIFQEFFEEVIKGLPITLVLDDALWLVDPRFGDFAEEVSAMFYMARSAGTSLIAAVQRPAFLPLICYTNASHFFTSRTTLNADLKRIAEMNPEEGVKEVQQRIRTLKEHDYLYMPLGSRTEIVNVAR